MGVAPMDEWLDFLNESRLFWYILGNFQGFLICMLILIAGVML